MKTPIISVIDDDESSRVSIQSLLRSLGYAVHAFSSAQAFLQSGVAPTSSCIISDIQMPGMDGLALQAQLRASGSKVPIIFITAFYNPATEARAKKGGALCVLQKPFDSDLLLQCLADALKTGSANP